MKDEQLNRQRGTERVLEAWLQEGVRALPDGDSIPAPILGRVITDVERTPQQTGRLRWLTRLGVSPPSDDRRNRLMLSATGLVAAIAVLALATNTVLTQTATDTATAPGAVTLVSGGTNTDHPSIAAAIAAAEDGDEIVVGPGTYVEAFTISRDVDLRGEGPREEIILVAPEDGPRLTPDIAGNDEYAILIDGAASSISGLTLRGDLSRVIVQAAQANLSDLLFDDVGMHLSYEPRSGAIVASGDSSLDVRNSVIQGSGTVHGRDGARVALVANEFRDGTAVHVYDDGDTTIEDNVFSGNHKLAISLSGGGKVAIHGNKISDRGQAIEFFRATSEGFEPQVSGNVIGGAAEAIEVPAGAGGAIVGNLILDGGIGIVARDFAGTITDNELTGNALGMLIWGGSPTVEGNSVEGGDVGVRIGGNAAPRMSGNHACGNTTDIDAMGEVDVTGIDTCESQTLAATE